MQAWWFSRRGSHERNWWVRAGAAAGRVLFRSLIFLEKRSRLIGMRTVFCVELNLGEPLQGSLLTSSKVSPTNAERLVLGCIDTDFYNQMYFFLRELQVLYTFAPFHIQHISKKDWIVSSVSWGPCFGTFGLLSRRGIVGALSGNRRGIIGESSGTRRGIVGESSGFRCMNCRKLLGSVREVSVNWNRLSEILKFRYRLPSRDSENGLSVTKTA